MNKLFFIDTNLLANLLASQVAAQTGLFKPGQRISEETAQFLNAFVDTQLLDQIDELQSAVGLAIENFDADSILPNIAKPPVHVHVPDFNPPAVSGAEGLAKLGFKSPQEVEDFNDLTADEARDIMQGGERRSAIYDGDIDND